MSPESLSPRDPLQLPDVWRLQDLAAQAESLPTGHAALDAQLPGGGWPVGALVEVLQQRPEQHAWQVLLPALSQAAVRHAGPVVLVGAPFEPFGPSLQAQGLPPERLLWVKAERPAPRLWAAEQALRCADVVAVLAWLPQVRSAELRRLQLAAHQHAKLLFVFRPFKAAAESSPARLRLSVDGVDDLQLHILKRRGPPLAVPLQLPAHSARLVALLQSRKGRGGPAPVTLPAPTRTVHGLDRTAALA
jgi:protein ImuA